MLDDQFLATYNYSTLCVKILDKKIRVERSKNSFDNNEGSQAHLVKPPSTKFRAVSIPRQKNRIRSQPNICTQL